MKRDEKKHDWRPRRHQGGFIREAVLLFVVLSVFGVVVLDILSVYSTHRTLKKQAVGAAEAANHAYVDTMSSAMAEQAAAQYLTEHGVHMVKFEAHDADGQRWYVVTAQGAASTYVFRYFTHLPLVGNWFKRQLHPVVAADNR